VGYHLGNILIHLVGCALLYLLVYSRMRSRGDSVLGWLGTLLLLALSMLSKQNGVVAPLLVLLFELIVVPGGVRSCTRGTSSGRSTCGRCRRCSMPVASPIGAYRRFSTYQARYAFESPERSGRNLARSRPRRSSLAAC
jgi:hypothetical protein